MYEQQPIQVHSLWIIDSQLTHTHTQAPTVCVCVSNSLHTFQVNENIFLHWVNKIINYLFHWRSPFSASLSLTGCVCLARMIIAYTRREIIRSLIFIQRVYLTIEMLFKIPLRQKCLLVDLPGALLFTLALSIQWCHYFYFFTMPAIGIRLSKAQSRKRVKSKLILSI